MEATLPYEYCITPFHRLFFFFSYIISAVQLLMSVSRISKRILRFFLGAFSMPLEGLKRCFFCEESRPAYRHANEIPPPGLSGGDEGDHCCCQEQGLVPVGGSGEKELMGGKNGPIHAYGENWRPSV